MSNPVEMMRQEHPITPPPELVHQWVQATESNDCIGAYPADFEQRICTAAARWGADQELEACRLWVSENHSIYDARDLRLARRPKPPSLKEQALDELYLSYEKGYLKEGAADTIRRALEALDD